MAAGHQFRSCLSFPKRRLFQLALIGRAATALVQHLHLLLWLMWVEGTRSMGFAKVYMVGQRETLSLQVSFSCVPHQHIHLIVNTMSRFVTFTGSWIAN